jgi:PKD repeat protein
MAEQIQIYQNQAVNFSDTSSGGQPPLSRLWAFSGGSISSATGATATVYYTNPGLYSVTLTVTDSVGTSKSLVETNLINVSAAYILSNFTGTPTSALLMSSPVNFVDASTGEPQPPDTFSWNIGGNVFATQNVSFSGFNDWFSIGGVDTDAPGDTISVSAQLTAFKGLLTDTEVKSFPVTKIGPVETTFINTRGTLFYDDDSIFSVEMSGAVPLVTSDISYPGSDIVYKLTTNNATQPLTSFHTTTEDVTLTYSGGINPIDTGLCESDGYLIVDEFLYNSGLPQIMDGQYITPDIVPGITGLYFTSQQLDNAYNGVYFPIPGTYAYSLSLVNDIVNSLYPQTNSGQAVSFGKTFETNEVYSTDEYPVVISPSGILAVTGLTGSYNINLTVNYVSGSPQTAAIQFNANGGQGNEILGTGLYYVMQDTAGPLLGVASMINLGIVAGISGGTGTIEAFANPIYNTNISGGLTGDYNGLSLKIKSLNVSSISITDNSQVLSPIIPPFGFSVSNPAPKTCTGILMNLNISSYVSSYGTQLNYGGSIL